MTLTSQHPKYVPTYYHFGKLLQEIGELKNAQDIFETGIALAKELNEQKALRELKVALQELEDELL